MPLTCNLDAKGKALRLVSGIVVTLIGLGALLWWALPQSDWTPWVVCLLTIAFGAFQIFEGWAGWCVVRALGIRTRI